MPLELLTQITSHNYKILTSKIWNSPKLEMPVGEDSSSSGGQTPVPIFHLLSNLHSDDQYMLLSRCNSRLRR